MSFSSGPQRPILLHAVRDLIDSALSERTALPLESPERRFFLGVDAAAQEVLHPELASSRPADWPRSESPAFQEGYLKASTLIAAARTAADTPLRILLPQPDPDRYTVGRP